MVAWIMGLAGGTIQAQFNCSGFTYQSVPPPTFSGKTCSDQSVFGSHSYSNTDKDYTTTGTLTLPTNSDQITVSNDGNLLVHGGECVEINDDFEVSALANGSFCAFTEEAIFNDIMVKDIQPDANGVYHIDEMKKWELGINLDPMIQDDVDLFISEYDKLSNNPMASYQTYFEYNYKYNQAPGLNPYDPEHVDLQAIFISPSGKRHGVYGFYYQEVDRVISSDGVARGWVERPTDCPWRVRFTPDEPGQWTYFLSLQVNGKPVGGYLSKCRTFQCNADANAKGFVKIANNKRYFEFEKSGELFMPLATSVDTAYRLNQQGCPTTCAEKNDGRYSYMMGPEYDYHDYMVERVDALSANGGNTLRSLPVIEWEHLGIYHNRQYRMMEFDDLIDYATTKGVYFQIAGIFRHTATWNKQDGGRHAPNTWFNDTGGQYHSWLGETGNNSSCPPPLGALPKTDVDYIDYPLFGNPYNRELLEQTPAGYNPYEMYDPGEPYYGEVKKLSKRLIRYYAARWGYSPNIFLVTPTSEADQMFNNEPDTTINDNFRHHYYCIWRDWNLEMVEYYKYLVPHHIVSSNIAGTPESYTGGPFHDFYNHPLNEVVVHNLYTARADRLRKFSHYLRKHSADPALYGHGFDKPALYGEFGVNYNEFLNANKRALNDSLIFHNQIWMATMSGTAGGIDFWGNVSYRKNCFSHFQALEAFLNGLGSNSLNTWSNPRPMVTKNFNSQWYSNSWDSDVPPSHTILGTTSNSTERWLECFAVKDNADIVVAWVHNMWSHFRLFSQAAVAGASCYVPKYDLAQLNGLIPDGFSDPPKYKQYKKINDPELIFPSLQQNGWYKVELWDTYNGGMLYFQTLPTDANGNLVVGGNFIPDLGGNTFAQQLDPALRKPADYALIIRKVVNKKEESGTITPEPMGLKVYPNPFRGQVTFSLDVPHTAEGSLKIFNLQGVMVAEVHKGTFEQGHHELTWQSDEVPAGMFLYEFRLGEEIMRGKIEHLR